MTHRIADLENFGPAPRGRIRLLSGILFRGHAKPRATIQSARVGTLIEEAARLTMERWITGWYLPISATGREIPIVYLDDATIDTDAPDPPALIYRDEPMLDTQIAASTRTDHRPTGSTDPSGSATD